MRSNARAVAAELARHELTNLHADSRPRIEDRAIENQPRKATNQKNSYDMRTIIKFTEELARSTPEVRQELRRSCGRFYASRDWGTTFRWRIASKRCAR